MPWLAAVVADAAARLSYPHELEINRTGEARWIIGTQVEPRRCPVKGNERDAVLVAENPDFPQGKVYCKG